MPLNTLEKVSAFAPATCGNVIVGFDILGLAISNIGDQVTLSRRDDQQIVIEDIIGTDELPMDPKKNVVASVINALCQDLNINCGINITLNKGIPLSSGMGGSAASGAAALTAFNQLLTKPLNLNQLAQYALQGEAFCSGHAHADNVVPALFGGITLTQALNPIQVTQLPIPDVICVVVHPHLEIQTQQARELLSPTLTLQAHTQQSAHLASFISALYQQDRNLLKQSLHDVVVEPQRASLIPGFTDIKHAALDAGALGVSLSGAGPSLLAFASNQTQAQSIGTAMQQAFSQQQLDSDVFISPISPQGAYVVQPEESICNSTAP